MPARDDAAMSKPGRGMRAGLAPWRLRQVLRFVDEHLGERVSVGDLARVSGQSASHFTLAFRQSLGTTPRRWLMARRIERATALLRCPEASIAQVALALGFCSQPHFTTAFKKLTGTTPMAFRMSQGRDARTP